MCSVEEDAPVVYEGVCDDFINLKIMCQLSFSNVHIRAECACVYKNKCICVCVSVCICIVLKEII